MHEYVHKKLYTTHDCGKHARRNNEHRDCEKNTEHRKDVLRHTKEPVQCNGTQRVHRFRNLRGVKGMFAAIVASASVTIIS